jgi:valyl-tRNA synthetase
MDESEQKLEKFRKPYNSNETEGRIYKQWEESGYFNPDNLPTKLGAEAREPFTITLPPPNVTGILHLGHAYEDTLQDVVARYKRMDGKAVLWVPGTDSAAIATQSRVEKDLQKDEGKSRHDIGRDELVKRVSEFAKSSEDTIVSQVKRMGASLDWSRYAYTLDDSRTDAVATAFTRMFEAGLIYRGNRIVNWDPKGQTTISDDEIVHEERTAKLYTFRYSKDFPIPIATTRLETKVCDVAVAVHPDDARYAKFVGKEYDAVFCDVPIHIKVIADKEVDPEYGTGALGVTPAHSMIDWDIAERNNLPKDRVALNEYAKMVVPGRLEGMKVAEARETIAAWLSDEGLLEKEEDVQQNVATAERTGGIIEPLPKLQWFIAVDKPFTIEHSEITGISDGDTLTLKSLMKQAVESGDVQMPQENFKKIYFHWIENLHDWCISRQIWFGHRIPIWYRGEEMMCSVTPPAADDNGEWTQDPDVLDTWFSSALWTFSTLGWPEETRDLQLFHPTSFMSPAYEILQLWVSRMILMSGFHLGQVPFKLVLIHGLVRDKQGRKFSKSLGNGIDPIQMIDKYGADALRMGLLVGAAIGSDIRFDEDRIKGYKHFANKLWNITRFVLENTQDISPEEIASASLTKLDALLVEEFGALIIDVTKDLDEYRVYLAAEKIYQYVWHKLADEIIEASKPLLTQEDAFTRTSRQAMLRGLLSGSLKLLHPFMPFVTEEIWQNIPGNGGMLMIAEWPSAYISHAKN